MWSIWSVFLFFCFKPDVHQARQWRPFSGNLRAMFKFVDEGDKNALYHRDLTNPEQYVFFNDLLIMIISVILSINW